MGTVFLAHDRRHRAVAVKVLHEHLRSDPVFRQRFAQEVAAARRVAGFCTARVLDADLRGKNPYLATEYVEGLSLHAWVSRNGPMSTTNAEALAVGIAAALTAIHAAHVVHRDLKPQNVMLSPQGPKVIDFGIAGAAAEVTGAVRFGTPGWLAPEQAAGHQGGQPADVFAWGLLVAWASTGRHPFGSGPSGTPDLDGVSPRLLPLVRACLATDPAARPSARELLSRLVGSTRPAAVHTATAPLTWPLSPVAARPPSRPPARRKPPAPTRTEPPVRPPARPLSWQPPPRRKRHPWRLTFVLLGLGAIGVWVLSGLRQSDNGNGVTPGTANGGTHGRAPVQTARDGKLTFTVNKLSCGDTELGDWPTRKHAKGRFCLLDLSVTNNGNRAWLVYMGSQKLIDTTGNEYAADAWSWLYYSGSRAFTSTVDPGKTVEGTLVFDTPEKTRFSKVIVHDSPLSDGTPITLR
jgi:serine/threonine protein kinase